MDIGFLVKEIKVFFLHAIEKVQYIGWRLVGLHQQLPNIEFVPILETLPLAKLTINLEKVGKK
jgi:hypothetical protein